MYHLVAQNGVFVVRFRLRFRHLRISAVSGDSPCAPLLYGL